MDEDDILIEVKLDDREITRQMDALGRKLQKSLNVALGGTATGGGSTNATRAIKDQEAAAIKLAQAQARLATASGDLTKAQNTLNTALAGVNKTTTTSIAAQTQLAQVHQRMARNLKDVADTLQNIGTRLTIGLTLPLGALAGAAIKTAVDFDSLKRGLISVSGSAAEAEKQLVRLKEVAKLPGLSFREAIQGSINLQAAGLSAERSEKALRVFGNALATVGKGSTELSGVVLALSQIESKGKVSAEEINQLAERVPQIRKAMIAAFGTADTEVIQKAKITSGKFIDAVVTELDKLPKVTGGARNTFENLKDSIEQSLLPLGNRLLETILPAIEKLTPKLLGLLEGFQKLSPEVQTLAIGFGAVALAAGPLISALGNILFLLTQIRNLGGISSVLGLGGLGGIAGAAGGAAALGVGLSAIELQQRIRAGDATFAARGGRLDLEGKPVFGTPGSLGGIGSLPGFRVEGGKLVPDAATAKKTGPAIDAVALAKANAKAKAGASRARFVNDFGLAQTAILENDIERARIRLANQTLAERREEERTARLEEGRLTRVALTREFDESSRTRLEQGRLTRAGLTEDFERRAEAQEKFNEKLKESIKLAQEMDPSFRFMRGLRGETDQVAASFERLGQNIGDAFGDLRNLLSSLANAVKQFFGDILSATLRSAAAAALAPVFGGAAGGGLGNLFRTPSFAQAFAGAGSGGITAPPSLSGGGFGGILSGIFGGGGGGPATRPRTVAGSTAAAAGGFSLGALGRSFGAAAPFLGLGLGSGLGGQSRLGQIAGLAGGLTIGTGIGVATGAITSPAITALFANPFTIPLAAGLLVGSIFLGKAKQRKQDEQASGQFLTQALQGIEQLATAIATDQIEGSQARAFFDTQILGPFKQQISGLKTASVVKSRLTNQVNDLNNVYRDRIEPLIADQVKRRNDQAAFAAFDRRLVPQFATGGITSGGLAFLHDREMVLTQAHQRDIRFLAGGDVFERVGVPGVKNPPVFDDGGVFRSGQPSGPAVINLSVMIGMTQSDAQEILASAVDSRTGQRIIVNALQSELTRRN